MRDDALADYLAGRRFQPSPLPARDMYDLGHGAFSGAEVTGEYAVLVHYTTQSLLPDLIAADAIGNPACWLTPTPYASCMTPHDLGLPGPRNACLVVDVSGLDAIWGPGTSPPSPSSPGVWRGGGIEFYCPEPVPFSAVEAIIFLEPCGDTHP